MHEQDHALHDGLQDTMKKLQNLETANTDTQISIKNMSKRLDQQGAEIAALGTSLYNTNKKVDKVSETQISHGNTMIQMNASLNAILSEVSKLSRYTNQSSTQDVEMAESSQGGEVEEK